MTQRRLVVAMCIYNEEDFIEKTIDSLLAKVKDVDVIDILDGAWKNGGDSPISTDKTFEIITRLQLKYFNRCSIEYRAEGRIFDNEAAKRNNQLEYIESTYGYEPYNVLVLDADERFNFHTGEFEMWIKDYLGDLPFIGCITSYAHSSRQGMIVPRIIPGGQGIHYHNNRSMIVHNGDHTLEIDYNLDAQKETFGAWINSVVYGVMEKEIYLMEDFSLINFYPTRSKARLDEKGKYCKFQIEVEVKENKPCNYQQKIRGTTEEIEA